MLLQQGPGAGATACPGPSADPEIALESIRKSMKEGWTVHTGRNGRIYYCNHVTHTAGWLPPAESWVASSLGDLPYGWEQATDHRSRPYYINHLNKTTTYEAPILRHDGSGGEGEGERTPEPRTVTLQRDPELGFGFVAGSEKPVIVRFVTEGGPSVGKLEPGDQILKVNGEEVELAAREHVIKLVRACAHTVTLQVRQPAAGGAPGRRSALLTRAARERLRARPRPPRVRFADSVCVNGAPLFPPSAFSLGDLCLPPMANVLKVFLENGQTKSFKYDSTTTVHDVVTSLKDKLCLSAGEHFSLVVEHVKSLRRNKLTLLDPKETLVRIASRPGAHKLRCLFRVSFVPTSAAELAQKDLNSMDYLYMQCCNDVAQERFAPELQADVALRLAALHMHQHALAHNMSPAKLTVKAVEREFGLERFIPCGLLESMKRKELRRLIGHFIKLNAQMTGNQQKHLSQLQAKLHYLDIISSLPSYGAKCFSSNQPERVLLVSPRFGLSQIAGIRNSVPTLISSLEDLGAVRLMREDELSYNVTVFLQRDRVLTFNMEDRDGSELALVLAGYYRLATGKELEVDQEREPMTDDIAPPYLSQHNVIPSKWSYIKFDQPSVLSKSHYMTFTMPPPYHSTPKMAQNGLDTNMNTTIANKNHTYMSGSPIITYDRKNGRATNSIYENHHENGETDDFGKKENVWIEDNLGFDFQTLLNFDSSTDTRLIEARNEEMLKRVTDMQKAVESSEQYLSEQGELIYKDHVKMNGTNGNSYWYETNIDKMESDTESSLSRISSVDDPPGKLKHSDSLILLTETINQGLNGINNDLNSILSTNKNISNNDSLSKRQSQGLSAILSNCGLTDALLALSNDLSQSESDNDSLYTPTNSPIHRHQVKGNSIQNKVVRTSFGLHSPDNPNAQNNGKEQNLREYLNQLRENSATTKSNGVTNDVGGEVSTSENRDSTLFNGDLMNLIDMDPDLIDLTLLPPPQTPDELDSISQVQVIATVPPSFADENDSKNESNLEDFLATVVVDPPTLKVTPAVELTPEEIMSYIIPPPPVSSVSTKNQDNVIYSNESQIIQHKLDSSKMNGQIAKGTVSEMRDMFNAKSLSQARNSLILNEKNIEKNNAYDVNIITDSNAKRTESFSNKTQAPNGHIIDYPTVERKGVFSCCAKENKSKSNNQDQEQSGHKTDDAELKPPPRMNREDVPKPPERPPKSAVLTNTVRPRSNSFSYSNNTLSIADSHENRFNTLNNKNINYKMICEQNGELMSTFNPSLPPCLPPRGEVPCNIPPHILLPPKKPPLPPVPSIDTLRMKAAMRHPSPILKNGSEQRVASIGSPHFMRNPNLFKDIENEHHSNSNSLEHLQPIPRPRTSSQPECAVHSPMTLSPINMQSKTGHVRSHSETKTTILKNKEMSTIFSLCSPQMNRKFTSTPVNHLGMPVDKMYSSSFNASDTKIATANCSAFNTLKSNHVRFKDQVDSYSTNTLPTPLMRQKLSESGVGGNGHVVSVELLLQKTEVAVDGLLSRLHQIAQSCSHQHAHGGGEDIDERKFQEARDQLTNEAVFLVTASRALVASLAAGVPRGVAAPLAECLTPLRRLTDLSQALARHTSSPLQTRNLVLRVHDVTAAFKELAGADMAKVVREHTRKMSDPQLCESSSSLEGQLALRAECLANVLATLLRSLRVFSP